MSRIKVDALQGTSGSDTAITLSGANATVGGTLAVTGVHTIGANAVATTGSTTTTVVEGLAKAFLSYKATDTASIYNSNNIASVTDHGTGDQSPNYTNNFSSGTSYACSAFGQEDSGGGGRIMCGKGTPGVGDRRVNTVNASNVVKDLLYFNIVYHGDLA